MNAPRYNAPFLLAVAGGVLLLPSWSWVTVTLGFLLLLVSAYLVIGSSPVQTVVCSGACSRQSVCDRQGECLSRPVHIL